MLNSRLDLTLDHVALVVSDLRSASELYARMGFNLSPRSSHKGRLTPDGPVELWGTGNHCAMFSCGYFEILGITDKDLKSDHVQVLLDRYEGLHLIALGCIDADAAANNLKQRLGRSEAPYSMSRDVPMPEGGVKMATFNLLHLPDDTFPEADLFLIEHKNRDVIWHPDMLEQPNGVVGLSEIVICSDNLQDTAERLSAVLGIQPDTNRDTVTFRLAHGSMKLITSSTLGKIFPRVQLPVLPWVAAVEFEVSELAFTRDYLLKYGFHIVEFDRDSLWIDASEAAGAIIKFSQHE